MDEEIKKVLITLFEEVRDGKRTPEEGVKRLEEIANMDCGCEEHKPEEPPK